MKTSKGEEKIIKLLSAARIKFKREVSFKGLTGANGVLLRFDFALFNARGQLCVLLELDGRQHFEYTPFFHKTKNEFYRQLEWDRRKNKFCLLNQIPLIRIPYWDIDDLTIDKILKTKAYRVKCKDHNILLAREVRK